MTMTNEALNVLSLCKGGSTLSTFGEVILDRLGRGKFHAFSAGSNPQAQIGAKTLYQPECSNCPQPDLKANDWNDCPRPDAPDMDFIFVPSEDVSPSLRPDRPSNPLIMHRYIADTADAAGGEADRRRALARAPGELKRRISVFSDLQIDSLDRLKKQPRLDDIGAHC